MSEDYNKWTVKELRAFGKKHDIDIPSKARKAEIVKIVEEATKSIKQEEVVQETSSEGEGEIEESMLHDSQQEKKPKEYDFHNWTVSDLKEFCRINNIKIPAKSKKEEIIQLLEKVVEAPEFVDRTDLMEKESLEEELIAGEDEDPESIHKEKLDLKFWNKPPFSSLLDPEVAKESNVAFYDLGTLVDSFFDKMLREDIINYKISGIALKTSASLHHYKISSIIKEEEEIQKKEELEKFRRRHSRTIPKALPQPIQPKMQISTKDELFDAMRSAIIEVMQKKEKLKRRRMRREEIKRQRTQMRSKARLPKELLKHISGKEQTVGELHASWLNRIKNTITLNDKSQTSFFDLIELIKHEEESAIGRKFSLVRLFLALLFLSTSGASGTGKTSTEINLFQEDDFLDIQVGLKS